MDVLVVLLSLVLLAAVIAVIAAPLRASLDRPAGEARADLSPRRADLETAREAKYREIRDAELDFRTGKLSTEDYAAIDAALRSEALAILDRLEALDEPEAGPRPEPGGSEL